MNHVVAILAHKNGPHLELLVQECRKRNYNVFIHLDQKSRSTVLEQSPDLASFVIPTSIPVSRGHFSIVEASLLLMEAGLNMDFDYFHLISGEDFLTKSITEFESFFNKNKGQNFINHFQLPVTSPYSESKLESFSNYSVFKDRLPLSNYQHAFFKNGIGLVDTFHFRPGSFASRLVKTLTPLYRLRQLYSKLFKRKVPGMQFYGGSAWFSVTKELTEHFVQQSKLDSSLLKYFKNVLFPDEIYFHTVAMNSIFKESIINSDLRYINWEEPIHEGPGIIQLEEVSYIKKSNGFFARKCDLAYNVELLNQIEKDLF